MPHMISSVINRESEWMTGKQKIQKIYKEIDLNAQINTMYNYLKHKRVLQIFTSKFIFI